MPTRRQIVCSAGIAGAWLMLPGLARSTPQMRDAALATLTGGAAVNDGRVTLTVPGIAENGLSVYTKVHVESPMSAADHVRAIHILAAENPIAHLLTWHLGPRSGIAQVATNIRLAASQEVTALAELSDGTFWRDRQQVVVAIAACIDGG